MSPLRRASLAYAAFMLAETPAQENRALDAFDKAAPMGNPNRPPARAAGIALWHSVLASEAYIA